jgi:hypothetical protein
MSSPAAASTSSARAEVVPGNLGSWRCPTNAGNSLRRAWSSESGRSGAVHTREYSSLSACVASSGPSASLVLIECNSVAISGGFSPVGVVGDRGSGCEEARERDRTGV